MTDRELLELAAKALGRELGWQKDRFSGREYCGFISCADRWSPLSDDGDALRLATALRISIIRDSPNVQAVADQLGERKTKIQEDVLYQCKHVATRRAIVRAAAEIGLGMP